MRLIQSETFLRSLDRLEAGEQTLVKAAVMDFFRNLMEHGRPGPGLRFHKIDRTVRDPGIRSLSVSMDLRIIVHQNGGDYVLLYTDHHDAAYAWAERRRLQPNPQTGAMQLINLEEVTQVVTQTVKQTQTYLFAHYEAEYLMSLGVPQEYVEAVRHATDENFDPLFEVLPDEASERLLDLIEGKLVVAPTPVKSGDPFDHPDARKHFALTTDEEELARAMQGRWADWMVYLHPSQRTLAERRQSGPFKVFGSAGTGKTVVALHRVASLVRQQPWARVLLTSYNRSLSRRLAEKLDQLLPERDLRRQVTVTHVHSLVMELARKWHLPHQIVEQAVLDRQITQLAQEAGLSAPLLIAEWHGVIEPQGIRSWEEYRQAPRTGRGTPLGARQRRDMWRVFERLLATLQERGQTTWSLLSADVQGELARRGPQFDHVVADEAQDFGPAELKLLRALVPAQENDLFLCGDPGQQIYKSRSSWLACGIDVRGRSQRLKINYRTSREIRQEAERRLGTVNDEEGQPEHRRTVNRFSGPAPELRGCSSGVQQVQVVAEWIQERLAEGTLPGEMAVITRVGQPGLARQLSQKLDINCQALGDDETDSACLTVTNMHRVKGMEFRAVVVAGLSAEEFPLPRVLASAHDPADREARLQEERRLLYVATTRARERLLLTWVGNASPLLMLE